MTPFLVNPQKKRRRKNPSHLMLTNKRKGKKKMAQRKRAQPAALKRYWNRKSRRPAARRRPRPRRRIRSPRGVPHPTYGSKRRSYRRNPLIRGKAFEQILLVGAGFLAAPMVTNLIPFTPTTGLGEYIKKAAAVTIGATVVTQIMGKRYGNALLLGGMISVGVDVLRDFVPAFGGTGMGAYFPPNAEIEAMSSMGNGMAASNLLPETSGVPGRWASRYSLPAEAGIC